MGHNNRNFHQNFAKKKNKKPKERSDAHLGFSEGRGPNFRKKAYQYKTKRKQI